MECLIAACCRARPTHACTATRQHTLQVVPHQVRAGPRGSFVPRVCSRSRQASASRTEFSLLLVRPSTCHLHKSTQLNQAGSATFADSVLAYAYNFNCRQHCNCTDNSLLTPVSQLTCTYHVQVKFQVFRMQSKSVFRSTGLMQKVGQSCQGCAERSCAM